MAQTVGFRSISLRVEDGIATLTLNRPERLNAIGASMGSELRAAWQQIRDDDDARVVIITGAGRGFCSGLDLADRADDAPAPDDRASYHDSVKLTALHCDVWKPVITAVNGVCAGGGLHFIADSDITICSEEATFLDPHVSVGQVSALEPIGLLRRIPFEAVMRMSLLGKAERLSAHEALRWGLVSEVVEAGELMARARELAEGVARNSPAAVMATKRAIWESLDHGLSDGLENGWRILQEHYVHPDVEEGPRAFAEKREPRWAKPSARRAGPPKE
jgi:enoyl-CoA hydratase/carnithine racemase